MDPDRSNVTTCAHQCFRKKKEPCTNDGTRLFAAAHTVALNTITTPAPRERPGPYDDPGSVVQRGVPGRRPFPPRPQPPATLAPPPPPPRWAPRGQTRASAWYSVPAAAYACACSRSFPNCPRVGRRRGRGAEGRLGKARAACAGTFRPRPRPRGAGPCGSVSPGRVLPAASGSALLSSTRFVLLSNHRRHVQGD